MRSKKKLSLRSFQWYVTRHLHINKSGRNQIGNLSPGPSFSHNICFKYPNGSCKPILDIYVSRYFEWYKEIFMNFNLWNHPLKIRESIRTWSPKVGVHLRVWGVHSLTFSYTPKSMKCDSWTSLLAHISASPCLGHEPKVRVGTTTFCSFSLAKTTSKTIVRMVSMGGVKEGIGTTMEVDSIVAEVATKNT
jgi:hypothetical protein